MENCQDDNCRYNLIYHKIKMPLRNVQTNIPDPVIHLERSGCPCPGHPWFIRLVTHYKCFSIQKTYFSKPARTRINRKTPESTGNHVQSTSSSCLFQPYTRDIFPRGIIWSLKKIMIPSAHNHTLLQFKPSYYCVYMCWAFQAIDVNIVYI